MSNLKVARDSTAIIAGMALAGLVALVLVGSFAIWTAGHLTWVHQRAAASAMVKAPEIAAPLTHAVPPG